jgi:hypothetical protein
MPERFLSEMIRGNLATLLGTKCQVLPIIQKKVGPLQKVIPLLVILSVVKEIMPLAMHFVLWTGSLSLPANGV